MGGAVSAGQNNDELVDNLCYENYIHTPEVERVITHRAKSEVLLQAK